MLRKKQKNNYILYPNISNVPKNIDGIFIPAKKTKQPFVPLSSFSPQSPLNKVQSESKHLRTNKKVGKNKTTSIPPLLLALFLIFIFSLLPIKIINTSMIVEAKAKNAMGRFESAYLAIENRDYQKAKEELTLAQRDTQDIKNLLNKFGQQNIFLAHFLPLKDMTINNENLLELVSSFSKIGVLIIDDIISFSSTNINEINTNKNNLAFFENVKNLNKNLKALEKDFAHAKQSLALIEIEKLNTKEKGYLSLLKEKIEEINKYYYLLTDITEQAPVLLGQNFDKKYLLLFQNNTELRATGGFIGTYGILTVRDAKVKNIFIDSIYNPDGQISKNIPLPSPLKKITPSLGIRDANWNPDFAQSAKSIIGLYESAGGFTPDNVIAIDTKPFLDLLEMTGPIELKNYGVQIDKDNFISEIQYKTSIDYNPADKNPKKFLADFAPLFLDKLFSIKGNEQTEIFKILIKNIEEKHIQFFSSDETIQNIFSRLEISGEMKNTEGDYFSYINSNIGGMKTNGEINESLSHNININPDGRTVHTIELKRKHNGSYNWPSGINYSYMRFYLPNGSKILEIKNFEKEDSIKKDEKSNMLYLEENALKAEIANLDIYLENNKTVVGAWQVLKPGEEITSLISYELPYRINTKKSAEKYTLLIQKQAGIISQQTNIQITTPSFFNLKPVLSPSGSSKKNIFKDSFELTRDQQIGVILKK